jgi:uncharacterized protein (TIGR02444 family)
MADAAGDFWRFSMALYAWPEVAPCCLVLQDAHGVDVNLALYCAWLGASGRGRLTASALSAADEAVASWRVGVIERLRAARRVLKEAGPGLAVLYAKAKAIELEAEHEAQRRLAPLAPLPDAGKPPAARLADAIANLTLYLGAAAPAEPIHAALREMAPDFA